jgi:hypothetical protein
MLSNPFPVFNDQQFLNMLIIESIKYKALSFEF